MAKHVQSTWIYCNNAVTITVTGHSYKQAQMLNNFSLNKTGD